MRPPHPLLGIQLGVYTTCQAATFGLRRNRQGQLPGVRVLPGVWSLLPGPHPPERLWIAALLYARPGARLTGCAAAAKMGWLPTGSCKLVRVNIPAARRRRDVGLVRITRTRVEAGLTARGMALAAPERILVDCALDLPQRALTAVTATALQRREVSLTALAQLVAAHPHLPGAAAMKQALRELRGGAESIKEVDCHRTFARLGLPTPRIGMGIFVGTRLIAVPDFWWQGVAGFYDGATHLDRESQLADAFKRTELEALGIPVVVITAGVLAAEQLLKRRIETALATAALRGGDRAWHVAPIRRPT